MNADDDGGTPAAIKQTYNPGHGMTHLIYGPPHERLEHLLKVSPLDLASPEDEASYYY